ncbi:MAG TPA: membrane dipeptidase, partial [Chitinophagales bacterium]|nr:membrane dipeptidase [Chitinophagales bacterium]
MTGFFSDLHCHPALKAFNSGHPLPSKSMWDTIRHECADNALTRLFRRKSNSILKESQCSLYQLARGGVRVVLLSMYPPEKGFVTFRKVPEMIFGEETVHEVLEHISGVHKDRVRAIHRQENHYFHDLNGEYEYIRKGQGASPCGRYQYALVSNYTELQHNLQHKPDTINIILSIEGAHSLGCGNSVTENMTHEQLKEELTRNIRKMKSWVHVPFSINLAHHFWNQLCGHAPSIPQPFNTLVNQTRGMNAGLTDLGRHVILELLGRHNGKRVILDTKHMSVAARKEYYDFVRKYNYLNPTDKIPVLCSHTGVNGFVTMDESLRIKDHNRKSRYSYLHRRSINISDEEIRIIHESQGIIGIMMDKGNLGGIKKLQEISALEDVQKKTDAFSELIWNNIFQIVHAVGQPTAWDIIGIGSDYDGMISHVDVYHNAETFRDMEHNLTEYLDKTKLHREMWYHYQPHELVSKILR